jgi:hypothetical protein
MALIRSKAETPGSTVDFWRPEVELEILRSWTGVKRGQHTRLDCVNRCVGERTHSTGDEADHHVLV